MLYFRGSNKGGVPDCTFKDHHSIGTETIIPTVSPLLKVKLADIKRNPRFVQHLLKKLCSLLFLIEVYFRELAFQAGMLQQKGGRKTVDSF